MKRAYFVSLTLLLMVGLAASAVPHIRAASSLQASMYSARGYELTGSADTNDSEGNDYVCVICRNSDGSLNDIDVWSFPVGNPINMRSGCDSQIVAGAQPFSVSAFDPSGPFSGNADTDAGAAYCGVSNDPPPTDPPPTDPPPTDPPPTDPPPTDPPPTDPPPTDPPPTDPSPTGALPTPVATPEPVQLPTCIDTLAIPDSTVGGTFVRDAALYWEPSANGATEHVIPAGNTARMIGVDESGSYAKIIWVCDTYWVERDTLAHNEGPPWNGAPLPEVVVN